MRTRQRDTPLELALRRSLHGIGMRYRVHVRPLPEVRRRADIVFRPARVAVFVDGCFWHLCPRHRTWPRSNALWWRSKLRANWTRDRETDRLLKRHAWLPVHVWGHEGVERASTRIVSVVRRRAVNKGSRGYGHSGSAQRREA
jgi:DNA mismatch endonuclease (patch repair protein)